MPLTRFAIADDCSLARHCMTLLVSAMPDYKVTIQATNGQELVDQLSGTLRLPDVCLLDIGMPVMSGYDAIQMLEKRWPFIKIIVLSQYCGEFSVNFMLSHGASAFLSKQYAADDLKEALLSINEPGCYVNIGAKKYRTNTKPDSRKYDISPRQKIVLQLIFEGYANKFIADKMNLCVRTVESHRDELCKKFNLHTRGELFKFVVENELYTAFAQAV